MPLVSPETVTGLDAPLPVRPPGLDVKVYEVIGLPLFGAAVKDIDALALPADADNEVAAPGMVNGVTKFDGAETAPAPAAFVATIVKSYDVPLVSPVTVTGLADADPVRAPGFEVAM